MIVHKKFIKNLSKNNNTNLGLIWRLRRGKMELTIFNEKVNTTEKIVFSGNTVQELLNLLKINSETVLVSRNNEIITEEEVLQENDKLDILSVISGG